MDSLGTLKSSVYNTNVGYVKALYDVIPFCQIIGDVIVAAFISIGDFVSVAKSILISDLNHNAYNLIKANHILSGIFCTKLQSQVFIYLLKSCTTLELFAFVKSIRKVHRGTYVASVCYSIYRYSKVFNMAATFLSEATPVQLWWLTCLKLLDLQPIVQFHTIWSRKCFVWLSERQQRPPFGFCVGSHFTLKLSWLHLIIGGEIVMLMTKNINK